jgi:hypothetical protein
MIKDDPSPPFFSFMPTQNNPTSLVRVFKLMAVFLIFMGLIFTLLGGYETYQGVRTKGWPAAEGVIRSSKIESRRKNNTIKSGGSKTVYSIEVQYTYMVGDLMHRGNNLGYGDKSFNSRHDANQAQKPWLKGKKVKVFYDPQDPKKSVLKTGMGMSWLAVAFGMVFTFLGLYLLRIGKKPAGAPKETSG